MRRVIGRGAVGVAVFVAGWGMALSSSALAQPVQPVQPMPPMQPSAGASSAESAQKAQIEQARQLYKDGVREAGRGQWAQARALFLEAFRLRPHFQIAFNLGQAELKGGEYIGAAEHLAFFLREAQGVGEQERRKAQEMLDEAEEQVVTLVLSTNQVGAEVLVDGVSVGTAPLGREVFVAPGRRVIQARLDGFSPVTDVRTVVAGASLQIELPLIKVGEAAASGEQAQGGGANKTLLGVGAAAGAVAASLGIGFTIAAAGKLAERGPKGACATQAACDIYNGHERARANLAMAAIASYVVAGVLGAGTLSYGLLTPAAKPPKAARAELLLGPGIVGAMATVPW